MIEAANIIFSLLTVLSELFILAVLIALFLKKRDSKPLAFLAKHAYLLAFLVVLGATAGSLFYSEVAGYEPCKLCWFQRIFLFPQVIILGLALLGKASEVRSIVVALSAIGALFAVYHNLLQFGLVSGGWCASTAVSCAQRFVLAFGYVTIPVMSLTVFLLIIALMIISPKTSRAGDGYK